MITSNAMNNISVLLKAEFPKTLLAPSQAIAMTYFSVLETANYTLSEGWISGARCIDRVPNIRKKYTGENAGSHLP